jgi:hypothetical protein
MTQRDATDRQKAVCGTIKPAPGGMAKRSAAMPNAANVNG